MPRKATPLTAQGVLRAKPGRYGDGGGLYLLVRETGRYRLFRYHVGGRMREMGLGPAPPGRPSLSLAEARAKARELWLRVRDGRDPLDDRDAAALAAKAAEQEAAIRATTFRDAGTAYIEAHKSGWRNAEHLRQWSSTLASDVYPLIGDIPVSDIDVTHVLAALQPIWTLKPETASRVRGRIEAVIDYARARGWRSGENPARWRGHIANLLPSRRRMQPVAHHPALPWQEVSGFVLRLSDQPSLPARALEYVILTAARAGEALGATCSEIDLQGAAWTVPAARVKGGREHRVPLSSAAVRLLQDLLLLRDPTRGNYVFPGRVSGKPLTLPPLLKLVRRLERPGLTTHGFRSTFRDWAGEATAYPHDVAEAALAHAVKDRTVAAYRRSDLFEKRRLLMEDWAKFCARPASAGGVVPLFPARALPG
jgi:integrase